MPRARSPSPRNVNIALALNDQLYPLVVQCTNFCLRSNFRGSTTLSAKKNEYEAIVKRELRDIKNSNHKIRNVRVQQGMFNHLS